MTCSAEWKVTSAVDEIDDGGVCAEVRSFDQRLLRGSALALRQLARCRAPGGQLRRQPLERLAHLIEIANALRVEWRDHQAALAVLDEQAAALQKLQGMTDRLARDAEPGGNAFLGHACAGHQRTIDDRGQKPVVHLIDEVGRRREGDKRQTNPSQKARSFFREA